MERHVPSLQIEILMICRGTIAPGAHQGPWLNAPGMLGCCSLANQYGMEEGAMNYGGCGGHQAGEFEMKDLGKTKFCLGFQLEHLPSGILVHQSAYI